MEADFRKLENGAAHCNLEVKARIRDVRQFRTAVENIATEKLAQQYQTDTYFSCPNGRLKLRQIQFEDGSDHAQLIHYARENTTVNKASHYRVSRVVDPVSFRETLASALGIWKTVAKRREIYLYRHVRIHIDEVLRMGDFMELEAVLSEGMKLPEQTRLVDWLCKQLDVQTTDRIGESYSDLAPTE